MSQAELQLRALPNVEFVHGYPGIPGSPERPDSSIRGFLEVRIGTQPVKAKWVRLEFRKVETIPSGKTTEEFVDHIGPGPITLWEAQNEQDLLTSNDLPFNLRIPENIPPSVALERGCGIKYELCATMSLIKRKKGLFRRDAKTIITRIVPIVIDKHELHSTWPVYGKHESRRVSRPDGFILIVDRGNSCFAPGDPLAVIATVRSENLRPVVVRSLELTLEEEITFQGGSQGLGKKNPASMNRVNIIGEHKLPLSYTLYGGTQQRVELAVNVPQNHTTTSVDSGRHIKIVYKVRVKCFLDNSPTLEIELPLIMTNWPRHVSAELTRRIGLTPNLTSRLSSQDVSSNVSNVPPPVPAKATVSKAMSSINGSTTSKSVATPITALSQASQVLSPTTASAIDSRIQRINSQGSSHEGATSESATHGPADEFGFRQGEISAVTAPARIGQRPVSLSDSDDRRSERDGSMSGGSLNRRTRSAAASNGGRFKVVNPDHNIPEESPSNTRVQSAPYPSRWPSAEAEKERLYEDAKARVAQVQSTAFQPPHTNGHISQPTNGSYETPRPVSPNANRSAWATAENEKQRLYEQAQAKVQETQGQIAMAPPTVNDPTPTPPPDLQSRRPNAEIQSQPSSRPTKSAGAALYSRAIEQISRSSTMTATASQPPPLDARRNLTFTASSTRPAVQDKSALLYYQAKQNVHRHLQEQGEVTSQEDGPIPYDQLFGGNAVASSSTHGHPPMSASSEKAMLRRHHEEMDARATTEPVLTREPSIRPQTAPTNISSSGPLSEKEIMRRAFEARDAALRAAGQIPPPILPDYNPPVPAFEDVARNASPPRSAAEEKAQLAERYRVEDEESSKRWSPPVPPPVSQSLTADPPELLNVVAPAPTRQRSVRSDVSGTETLLRRDPSVSAGKKRQMTIRRDSPSPPPLPPRPPQEYIEETQREDHRTTLKNALPLDFSTSFDLGFDNFGKEGRQTPDVRL